MIRNLKTLGLAVVAMLAMSAVIVAGAQASGGGTATVVGGGTVSYTATQTGGGHTFTLPGNRKMSCTSATFSGSITNNATTTVASPLYTGCTIEIGIKGAILPATVNTMSCQYDFTLTGPQVPSSWVADTNIVCGAGEDITISIYEDEAAHTKGETVCEYTIAPQAVNGVTFRNVSATQVGILATAVNVAYTKTKGPIGTCGGGGGNAVYQGDTTATGAGGVGIQIH